jgi:hypothetical protein
MNEELAKALIQEECHPDTDNYIAVTAETTSGQRRWVTEYEQVFQDKRDKRDGTYWNISWDRGSTEYQEYTDLNIGFYEVEPVETVIIKFMKKKHEI